MDVIGKWVVEYHHYTNNEAQEVVKSTLARHTDDVNYECGCVSFILYLENTFESSGRLMVYDEWIDITPPDGKYTGVIMPGNVEHEIEDCKGVGSRRLLVLTGVYKFHD